MGFSLCKNQVINEVAVAMVAGYLGYRILAYGKSFTEALEKTIKFREGKPPRDQM